MDIIKKPRFFSKNRVFLEIHEFWSFQPRPPKIIKNRLNFALSEKFTYVRNLEKWRFFKKIQEKLVFSLNFSIIHEIHRIFSISTKRAVKLPNKIRYFKDRVEMLSRMWFSTSLLVKLRANKQETKGKSKII